MRKSYLLFLIFLLFSSVYGQTSKVQKKKDSGSTKQNSINKNEYDDFNQVIINDTDFKAKITLLNEETFVFEEFELEPNEIHIIPERLFVNPTKSRKMIIVNSYIYIASIKYITPNEAVYLLKATRKNPLKNNENPNWDVMDDDVFVVSDQENNEEIAVQQEDQTEVIVEVEPELIVEEPVLEELIIEDTIIEELPDTETAEEKSPVIEQVFVEFTMDEAVPEETLPEESVEESVVQETIPEQVVEEPVPEESVVQESIIEAAAEELLSQETTLEQIAQEIVEESVLQDPLPEAPVEEPVVQDSVLNEEPDHYYTEEEGSELDLLYF